MTRDPFDPPPAPAPASSAAADLAELYQQVILDHARHPRNFRAIESPDAQAEGFNPLCGDRVSVALKLEGDHIADVAFTGQGCAICTASASLLTQAIRGRTNAQARALFEAFHRLLTKPTEARHEGVAREQNEDGAGGDEGTSGERGHSDGAGEPVALGKLEALAGVKRFPIRVKCATLPWHTLKAALERIGRVTTE